jgi:hypothetical protein
MQNSKHLNVFDFDDTLFRVPNYTASEAKGIEPYAWFDSPCSLDEIFGIRGIKNTISRVSSPGALSIMVTHRVEECSDRVFQILSEHGIQFDDVYFLGRGSAKADTVMEFLEGSNVESITIFEDTLWEVLSYALKFEEAKISQEVEFVFIDKSKIINIGMVEALAIAKSAKFEKLKLI